MRTWHIESARGTWLAMGFTSEEQAVGALAALQHGATTILGVPDAERELALGAHVVEDFDWGPFRLRLYRALT